MVKGDGFGCRDANLEHATYCLLKYRLNGAPAGTAGAHVSGYLNKQQ